MAVFPVNMAQITRIKVLDTARHRNCCGVTKSTQCGQTHRLCQIFNRFNVPDASASLRDLADQLIESRTALSARCTFSTGLVLKEFQVVSHNINDAVAIIHHKDRSTSETTARV